MIIMTYISLVAFLMCSFAAYYIRNKSTPLYVMNTFLAVANGGFAVMGFYNHFAGLI